MRYTFEKLLKYNKINHISNIQENDILIYNEEIFANHLNININNLVIVEDLPFTNYLKIKSIKYKNKKYIFDRFNILRTFINICKLNFKTNCKDIIKRTKEQLLRSDNESFHLNKGNIFSVIKFNKYIFRNFLRNQRIKDREFKNKRIFGIWRHYCYFHALHLESLCKYQNANIIVTSNWLITNVINSDSIHNIHKYFGGSYYKYSLHNQINHLHKSLSYSFMKNEIEIMLNKRISDPLTIPYMNYNSSSYADYIKKKCIKNNNKSIIKHKGYEYFSNSNQNINLGSNKVFVLFLSGFSDAQFNWGTDEFNSSYEFYNLVLDYLINIERCFIIIKPHPNSFNAKKYTTKFFDFSLQLKILEKYQNERILISLEEKNSFYFDNDNFVGISRSGSIVWESILKKKICFTTKTFPFANTLDKRIIINKKNLKKIKYNSLEYCNLVIKTNVLYRSLFVFLFMNVNKKKLNYESLLSKENNCTLKDIIFESFDSKIKDFEYLFLNN